MTEETCHERQGILTGAGAKPREGPCAPVDDVAAPLGDDRRTV